MSIEIQGAETGVQSAARNVRLIGITFDPKDSVGQEIDVIVRGWSDAHLMHAVQHPAHVRIARTEDGFDSALQLETEDGPTTLVRFIRQGDPTVS